MLQLIYVKLIYVKLISSNGFFHTIHAKLSIYCTQTVTCEI